MSVTVVARSRIPRKGVWYGYLVGLLYGITVLSHGSSCSQDFLCPFPEQSSLPESYSLMKKKPKPVTLKFNMVTFTDESLMKIASGSGVMAERAKQILSSRKVSYPQKP
jgi:hypothetical protein